MRHVTIHGGHRVQLAVDCECGTSVEACDAEELFDELLEHIAAAHESDPGRDPAAIMTESRDGQAATLLPAMRAERSA